MRPTDFFFSFSPIYLVKNGFRAVEKDQAKKDRTIFLPRKGGTPYDATDGCPKCNDGLG